MTYQADQFLDKNKDYVVAEHQDLLTASKCSFVAGLFPPLPEETSKSSKFSSIGSRFKVLLVDIICKIFTCLVKLAFSVALVELYIGKVPFGCLTVRHREIPFYVHRRFGDFKKVTFLNTVGKFHIVKII